MEIEQIPNFFRNHKQTIDKIFNVAERYKPTGDIFPIGIKEFDAVMDGGVREGELIVISAPTGEGKTTYAQQLTMNFDKIGVPSLWFSFEMNPYYLKEKFEKMGANEELLAYTPIEYLITEMKLMEMEIREAIEEDACKIIFIDHLHYLIPLMEVKNSSLLVGGIVRELKKMAVKNNVIIFLIAHTKKIYTGEELNLSSIRDSSLVSQESDYVFLLKRLKNKEGKMEQDSIYTNKSQITLAKNRRTGKMIYITCEMRENQFIPITEQYDNYPNL